MNFSGSAPVRQPVPELPENDFPGASVLQNPPKADENVVVYFRLLWEHRVQLRRVVLYGLLASTFIAFLIPARYQSTTRLMPPDSQSGVATAMSAAMASKLGGLAELGGGLLGMKTPGELFVGVLQSRTVQDDLIARFDLRKLYGDRYWEDARRDLSKHTEISEDKKSGIITIQVTDKNPQRAAAMGQEYVAELNQLINQLTTSSAHREREFLEQRLRQVKQELATAEQDFSQFASKNTAINIPEQGKAMVQAAATLQGQLIAAESELEGLRQVYTDNNVRVRALEARVAELRHQLDRLGGKPGAEKISAKESFYPSIRKLPLLGVAYADLYRETKIEEAVFETLTQEYELAKVEEVKGIPVVKVLDTANVPEKKSFPPRLSILLLGTAFSFFLGVFFVFAAAYWRQIEPQDPRRLLVNEVVGTIRPQRLWTPQNGDDIRARAASFWPGFRHRHDPPRDDQRP